MVGVLSNGISHPLIAPEFRVPVSASVSSALFEGRRQNLEDFEEEPNLHSEEEFVEETVANQTVPISEVRNMDSEK